MPTIAQESKYLAKHTMVYGTGIAINSVVAFLLLPIYTTYLTPRDYGIKELVGLTMDMVGILLATSIATAIYRFYYQYSDTRDRNEVISTAVISLGISGLVVVLVLSLFSRTMAGYIIDSPDLYYYFDLALASMWLNAVNGIGLNYLRAKQRSGVFLCLSIIRLIIVISLNLFFVVYLRFGILGILLGTLMTAVITIGILVIPIMFVVGMRFSMHKFKEMLRFGLPLIPSEIGSFIVNLSDRFFIKKYCSIADTGLYALGYRFGIIPSIFFTGPFNEIWMPRRLEIYNQPGSRQLFGRVLTYYLLVLAFIGLGVAVLTEDVLKIIANPKFWSAYRIVPIIVLSNIIFSIYYQFNLGIEISKKTEYLGFINFTSGLLVLLLYYLMIPPFGVYGGAYATLIAMIYKVGMTYYFGNKFFKIEIETGRVMKIIGAAALIYLLCTYVEFNSISMNLFAKTLIILLLPLFLWVLQFYSPEEKMRVRGMVRQVFNGRGAELAD
ncbi:MAG TPA: oligosaccharide flippase family protein [Deltaproteobacteria bacterium]|jgi:O-antigen/teichoic acid export membrane protein|nr:oligosaccharide flippase family protein [Deltaproteobacteria bacterium]HQI00981.1 oligosaccharide flippase family protein [Deltaproteobacteria bacterium]HQJ07637.1 oligosaccharide flippase family protein [Deltaproteobacteria bacterium]